MAHFNKSIPFRRFRRTAQFKRCIYVMFIVLLCAAILGLFWWLSEFGPKDPNHQSSSVPVAIPAEVEALQAYSIELEAAFEAVLTGHSVKAQDLSLLQRALDLQSQYVKALPAYNMQAAQRLANLEQRYQNLAVEQLNIVSKRLEQEAGVLADDRAYEAAQGKYQEAFALQNRMNQEFPLSTARNLPRAIELQRKARAVSAELLLQESEQLEAQADALIAQHDWEPATSLLQQAIAIQDRLNRVYRGTSQASVVRLKYLNLKLVEINSGQQYLAIQQMSDRADASSADNAMLKAARLYEEAARLQQSLNTTYPNSPHASAEQVLVFKRKSQTADSFELGLEIERNHDLLQRLLAARRSYEAVEVIVALRDNIKQMKEKFPHSSLNDTVLEVKVRYLNLMQNDLGYIQDRIYGAILPVPERAAVHMLRTELPQALYALIMGTNPSRHPGDLNPVDSVSWTEAKRFCERLSWILGRDVRLPTENEFRQALGSSHYAALKACVWSASDTDGVVQPVGQKKAFASGFYDLLGNVSEWLELVDPFESKDARHIGGHVQDRIEAIFTVPIRNAPRAERNRLTGFRIVVLVD